MAEDKINPYDRIRGAADLPLTAAGQHQVLQLGENFRKNGPLDIVVAADLKRTMDTGKAVANGAPMLTTHHLRDMDYGVFTGMLSKNAIPIIHKAIDTSPSQPMPGSNESFDQYKDRIINAYRLALQASQAFPQARIGLVVNRRSMKVAEGWLDNGKTDGTINLARVLSNDGKLEPGDVMKLTGNQEGEFGIKKMDTAKPMPPGVYLIRHGLTAWNGESYSNDGQLNDKAPDGKS